MVRKGEWSAASPGSQCHEEVNLGKQASGSYRTDNMV